LRRVTIAVALAMTLAAVFYNLVTCAVLFHDGITPLISMLAVGFGGYMALSEWLMLRAARSRL
jgi:hypothetical protein